MKETHRAVRRWRARRSDGKLKAQLTSVCAVAAVLAMLASSCGGDGDAQVTTPLAPNQFDAATKGFGMHMKLTPTKDWQVVPSDAAGPPRSETIALVHVGTPPSDRSQWWGPDIMIVNGARVHRVADAVSQQPANPDSSKFVPWPSDFFAYLSSLPGVKVISGPKSVTIGGMQGTRFTVRTPPMHPIIWLKGDSLWLGGGPSGVDPAMTRRITLLNVKGKKLLLAFADTAPNFKRRWPMVDELFGSIRF